MRLHFLLAILATVMGATMSIDTHSSTACTSAPAEKAHSHCAAPPPTQATKAVHEWTLHEVAEWVASLSGSPHFGVYSARLKENYVDGRALLELDGEDLEAFGVDLPLHRRIIETSVRRLAGHERGLEPQRTQTEQPYPPETQPPPGVPSLPTDTPPRADGDLVNFWDYRRLKKVRANLFLSGLINCPRLTVVWLWLSEGTVDIFGAGEEFGFLDSYLGRVAYVGLFLLAPRLVLAYHSWRFLRMHCFLVVLFNLSAGMALFDTLTLKDTRAWLRTSLHREGTGFWINVLHLLLWQAAPSLVSDAVFYVSLVVFLLGNRTPPAPPGSHARAQGYGFGPIELDSLWPYEGHAPPQPPTEGQRVPPPPPPVHFPPALDIPEALQQRMDLPQEFICPITHELMRTPAITPAGTTYEYEAVALWVHMKHTDPQAKTPITIGHLFPNLALRSLIGKWVTEQLQAEALANQKKDKLPNEESVGDGCKLGLDGMTEDIVRV